MNTNNIAKNETRFHAWCLFKAFSCIEQGFAEWLSAEDVATELIMESSQEDIKELP